MTEPTAAAADDDLAQLEAVVAEQRHLAAAEPGSLNPALADALMGLAARLGELGRHADSLAAGREGVDIFRALVGYDAAIFTLHLAAALNNLSNRLDESALADEARGAGEEAAALCRLVLESHPEQARFVLVSTLLNQSSRFWGRGESEPALALMAEAATVFREGGEGLHPFAGIMIEALHRNAMALAESGQWEQAVAVRRLSVDLFTPPAPAPVLQLLSLSLEQAAYAKAKAGDTAGAPALAEEAVAIARDIAALDPAQYTLFLAQSLANLASRRHDAGDDAGAFEPVVEAINTFQEAALTDAAATIMPLAVTLETFAAILIGLGHLDQARTVIAQRDDLVKLMDETEGNPGA